MESNILCQQITPQLDAFRDGELNADEAAAVEQHLTGCGDCQMKLAAIARVIETLRTMPRLSVPVGLSAKLDGIVDGSTRTQNVVPMSRKLRMPVAAAAAVAAIVFGVKFAVPGTQPAPVVADVPSHVSPAHQEASAPQTTSGQEKIAAQVEAPSLPTPAAATHNHAGASTGAAPEKHAPQHEANRIAPKPQIANNSQPLHTSSPDNGTKVASLIPAQDEPSNRNEANAGSGHSEVELAELPASNSGFGEAIGIATDEDGLYDIKM
jgi:anti-sigma factor RsiW